MQRTMPVAADPVDCFRPVCCHCIVSCQPGTLLLMSINYKAYICCRFDKVSKASAAMYVMAFWSSNLVRKTFSTPVVYRGVNDRTKLRQRRRRLVNGFQRMISRWS